MEIVLMVKIMEMLIYNGINLVLRNLLGCNCTHRHMTNISTEILIYGYFPAGGTERWVWRVAR